MTQTADNILIVDDEEDTLHLMSETLGKWGYNAVVARNGLEALEKFDQVPVDVVITDVRLPKMDGVTLLEQIKNRNLDTEVILFTGYPGVESAVDALKKGAYDYLIKPVDLTELKLKLERSLEKKALGQPGTAIRGLNWAMILSIPIWLGLSIYLIRLITTLP